MNSRTLGYALLLFGIAIPLAAQKPPKAVAGQPVATWRGKTVQGFEVGTVMVRNDTTVPIVITKVTLTGCTNIRVACGDIVPNPAPLIGPKGSVAILTILPTDILKPYSFIPVAEWRPATRVEANTARAGLAPSSVTASPEAAQIVIPPADSPAELKGVSVNITFYVSTKGTVDSVDIPAVIKDGYRERFRKAMMLYRFKPSRLQGVPTPGSIWLTITFN